MTYSLLLRSCRLMGAFIISPLPSLLNPTLCAARPLGSAGITPLLRYYEPRRHRFVFDRFPGCAGYTTYLLHRFLDGTKTVSPVARHVLATVLSLPPRRSGTPRPSVCAMPCCLRPNLTGSAFGVIFLSRPLLGSLSLRPGDSLTTPRAALSVGSIRFVSSTNTTQSTGLLTITPVGLSPTEHVSLSLDALGRQKSINV